MPHTHFDMPTGRLTIEEALQEAREDWGRESPHTYPILKAMVQRDQHESYTPSKFYGCDRSLYLRLNEDYAVNPDNAFARLRGSMFHSIMEEAGEDPDLLVEVSFCRPIKVDAEWVTITGRIDYADPKRGLLADYKTTKKLYPQGYPKPDDIGKLKLYAWMAEAHGLTLDKGELVYVEIATGRMIRSRVMLKPANEEWIRQRVREIRSVYHGTVPPIIDAEAQWLCDYCDVREQCELLSYMRSEPVVQGRPKKGKK